MRPGGRRQNCTTCPVEAKQRSRLRVGDELGKSGTASSGACAASAGSLDAPSLSSSSSSLLRKPPRPTLPPSADSAQSRRHALLCHPPCALLPVLHRPALCRQQQHHLFLAHADQLFVHRRVAAPGRCVQFLRSGALLQHPSNGLRPRHRQDDRHGQLQEPCHESEGQPASVIADRVLVQRAQRLRHDLCVPSHCILTAT